MTNGKGKTASSDMDAAERLFQSLRRSGLPLNEQLAQINAEIEKAEPRYARAYDFLVARLKRASAGDDAPKRGEAMPGFLLPDENGRFVSLGKLLQEGPVVIAFLRGHWCPFCRLNAAGLASIEDAIAPAQIVAISPETGEFSRTLRKESCAQFPFLTDVDNGYALSLGLAFWLGDDLLKMLHADACDVPRYHGSNSWFLPIPAVFVVGTDGLVAERYVNPDFRQRMEIDILRMAAQTASLRNR